MSDSRINADSYIVVQGWMITELNLKGNELLIFAIIHGFSQDNAGEFTGSLQYLTEWTNGSKRAVQNALTSLVQKGFLIKKEDYINGVKYCRYRCKNCHGYSKFCHEGIAESATGYGKNCTEGIAESATNNLSIYNLEDKLDIYIVEIVNYLNEKTGKNFSPNTASTRKHITARLKEGRTVEDFKRVVDIKCSQWLGTNFSGFLRPETLFAPTKFENYLNEEVSNSGQNLGVDSSVFGRRG